MARDLKFFHFGYQCPNNAYLIALIKTIAWHESVKLHLIDVTGDEETCRMYSIFSPTLVIVNDRHRWHGPFTKDKIIAMLEADDDIEPEPRRVSQGRDIVRGDLIPITSKTVLDTCTTCTGTEDRKLCYGKGEWVGDMMRSTGLPHLGYLHLVDGGCVGGAEYLPSRSVPYPIPGKSNDAAFLTCSYVSHSEKDFKTHPLERLVRDLADQGFKTLLVAASEEVVFPNGPAEWFEEKGFMDKGVLMREELHGAAVHLMSLDLDGR